MNFVIREFQGEHRWLSNMWECSVLFEGQMYRSSEAAYVAAKTTDEAARKHIRQLRSPYEAKKQGRRIPLRENWDTVKIPLMTEIVRDKFTRNEDLKARLLATGNAVLEEGNKWGDRFWGISPPGPKGTGRNELGKILMKIRDELRQA